MSLKQVVILGAGFSASAKIPVQKQILGKMIQPSSKNFLDDSDEMGIRFVEAYNQVGLYLLDFYTDGKYQQLKNAYNELTRANKGTGYIIDFIDNCTNDKDLDFSRFSQQLFKNILEPSKYIMEANLLRKRIQQALFSESIEVDLEDVFTSFDKALQTRVSINHYSYFELESLKQSFLRLFVYYFTDCINNYSFNQKEYSNFLKFVKDIDKNNLTIISTNWDTLLEGYFDRLGMEYDYSFDKCFSYEKPISKSRKNEKPVRLLKLHGSINWIRCLNCNALSSYSYNTCVELLFNDMSQESCPSCHEKARIEYNSVLLQPEILTPTMNKSINSLTFSSLWHQAEDSLRNAERIVFIGYSLPLADFEFRYLLQRCISHSAKIEVVLYHTDNPNTAIDSRVIDTLPEKRYRNIFPRNSINFHYEGVEQFDNYKF